jgi:hypothetical protein
MNTFVIPIEKPQGQMMNSRFRTIAYWAATGLIVLQCTAGAIFDLMRTPSASQPMIHLGYPLYLMLILGVWRALAGITLVMPRFPRLKEWAYAGLFFDFSGATVSHIAAGDGVNIWIWPTVFITILIASWALRPASRKLEAK